MRHLVHTFVGLRAENEDCSAVRRVTTPEGRAFDLLLLADGMGGLAHGARVSRAVVDGLGDALAAGLSEGPGDAAVPGLLAGAVVAVQASVRALVREEGWSRAGATLVAAVVSGEALWYVHLGDSRLYHWQAAAARLDVLTEDHSLPELLRARGLITAEMALVHPLRNQLVYFVGADELPPLVVRARPFRPGDRLLACSDGICGKPCFDEIAAAVAGADVEAAAARLFGAAMDAGSTDNMSLILYEHDGASGFTPVALHIGDLEAAYGARRSSGAGARPDRSAVLLTPASLWDDEPADAGEEEGDTLRK